MSLSNWLRCLSNDWLRCDDLWNYLLALRLCELLTDLLLRLLSELLQPWINLRSLLLGRLLFRLSKLGADLSWRSKLGNLRSEIELLLLGSRLQLLWNWLFLFLLGIIAR